jgi:hypothetical protein
MIGWKSIRRMLGGRHAWTATSWVMSTEVGEDLANDFVGDLGHAVLIASVLRDLFEDPFFGFGGECRRTTGYHGTTRECLHPVRPPGGAMSTIGGGGRAGRRKVALCCGRVTLAVDHP